MGHAQHGWGSWNSWVAMVRIPLFISKVPSNLSFSRLYIIEGLVTVVWAGCCLFLVPKNYETAYFLTDEDKALMRKRAEEMEAYSGGTGHYGKQEIKQAAKDVKSWMHGVIQIAVVTILYGNKPSFIRYDQAS